MTVLPYKGKKSPRMGIHVHVPEQPCVYFLISPWYVPAGSPSSRCRVDFKAESPAPALPRKLNSEVQCLILSLKEEDDSRWELVVEEQQRPKEQMVGWRPNVSVRIMVNIGKW